MKRIALYLLGLITALHISSACQRRAIPPSDNKTSGVSSATDDSASVPFKIQEVSRQTVEGGDEVTWLATHDSKAGVARFKIRMILKKPSGDSPIAFSKGAFLREKDSQPSEFLRQIAKALEAEGTGTGEPKVDVLDFTVGLLGQRLTRGSGPDQFAGGFTSEPPGDWIATKVFVADGEGEFFLNLNPKEGIGEISIKDSDYGDIVLQELARVF
jgi:hypothetical protein